MILIDPLTLKYIILLFIWIEFIWEMYLSIRQRKKVQDTEEVPKELKNVMNEQTFQKARLYTLAKSQFGFYKDTFSLVVTTFVIYSDLLSHFWETSRVLSPYTSEVAVSCVWFLILQTLSTVVDLPFTIYYTFVLEEKFGFNKQTAGFFIWDKLKSYAIAQVFSMIIASIVILVVRKGGDYFFVWLWAVVCIITLVVLTIYPSVIAPLFDTFVPLPEGELRTNIEKLASKLEFPLTNIYVVEGSKRSTHSNAYFYGLFKSKRIVLFDTLLAKDDGSGCGDEEILAVLCHELGHWKHNHITKNILVFQVNLFLLFYIFAFMFKYPPLYKALGFFNSQPVLVGLLGVLQFIMMPYNTLVSFLMTCLSRMFEFQADEFAVKMGKAEYLEKALVQLNKDNLGFPIYDNFYSAWHHSHPPLLERLEALKHFKNE
ncbi:CAAX prenyl protease 1 homolog [Coccinella septempunctata]|uniref:CAAX prenyl protease 1 homolog n=1 Tax=Coccinella septempunctata TaxID=41139 RepID=UPI001D05C338|nr:CAAX prenyl protease 1 homolog [Coccinella septempunctata]